MATSQAPSYGQERAYAFRKLLVAVSQMLTESEAKQIEYLRRLPQATGKREGLDVLIELEKCGTFSPAQTKPLIELLQEIERHDIANSVRDYQETYPDVDISRRRISRTTSTSGSLPLSPNVEQSMHPHTWECNVPDITVSLREGLSYPQLVPKQQEATDNRLSSPASLSSVSLDGCCIPPQQMEPESTPTSPGMSNGVLPSPPPNTDNSESELNSGENRSRARTGPSKSSRAAGNSYPARPVSWTVGVHETRMRPRSKVVSSRDRPKPVPRPKSVGDGKQGKIFSRSFSWTGKRDDEWSTQFIWSIQRQSLQQPIWDHHHLNYTQCSEHVPINIKCGDHNPYLILRLYPNGLFEDKNSHMTLFMKVTLPASCPPLPTTASFSLSWEICTVRLKDAEKSEGAEKLRCSKKPLKIPFDKGVVYIQKLLSHTALLQNHCEELQIRLSLSTSYSSDDVDVCGDISSSTEGGGVGKMKDSVLEPTYTEGRPTMTLLSCFKTADGNLNIPQEIGEHYMQFGCLLLNDKSGAVTKNIASRGDAARINHEILCQWLQGKGKMPVQWLTLIKTLKDIDMNVLASDIETHLRLNVMTDQP